MRPTKTYKQSFLDASSQPLFKSRVHTTKKGRITRSPKVKECKDHCFFKNDDNQWCWIGDPPVLRLGWEFGQTFGNPSSANSVKYWQLEFLPFYDAEIYIEQNFLLQMIHGHNLVFAVPEYRENYFFSIVFNGNNQYCMGRGKENTLIEISIEGQYTFLDCYKKLIDILFDESTTFKGYEAKYLDECNQSTPSAVNIRTWDYKEPQADQVSSGTVNPTSISYCKDLPLIGSSSSATPSERSFFTNAYSRLFEYMHTYYGSKQKTERVTTGKKYNILGNKKE